MDVIDLRYVLNSQRPRADGFQLLKSDARKMVKLKFYPSQCFLCTSLAVLTSRASVSYLIHVENKDYTNNVTISFSAAAISLSVSVFSG